MFSGCKGKAPEEGPGSSTKEMPAQPRANFLEGTVLETMNTSGYTYLKLDTGSEKVWVALPETNVKKGDKVKLIPNMELKDFKSKTLNRVFDRIIFATGMAQARHMAPHSQEMASPMGMGMSGGSKALCLPEGLHIEKAGGENGYTIGEIYEKRALLNGKTVSINGYVTKVLTGIMGKNWIHLQDGTGSAQGKTGDLVVTTSDLPNPGDIVHVTGKLSSDRDFGAGYRYDVIIEDASIEVIKKNIQDISKK